MFEPINFEVDIINRKKDSRRTVHITRGPSNPTVVLKKAGRNKETFNLMMVTALETSESTNLIQLTSDKAEAITIRAKSRESKEKLMKYLKDSFPRASFQGVVSNELLNKPRPRAATVRLDVRRPPLTTPRNPSDVQSRVLTRVTHLPSSMTASDLLDALPENEYDITEAPPGSLVSTEDPISGWPVPEEDPQEHVYDEVAKTEAVEEYDQYAALRVPPGPPQAARYINDRITPAPRDHVWTPQPCGIPPEDYTELRRDPLNGENPPNYMSYISEESACGDSESESLPYEIVSDPTSIDKQRYYARALKCEMVQKEAVTRGFERQSLLDLKMDYIEPYGVCINKVPPGLKKSFYEGDKIVNINCQKIINRDFARQLIETSSSEMVQVTVERLFMGHFIEIELGNPGESLGVDLDGTQIKSIFPGTHFGKQATMSLLETKMCITHINGEFLPPETHKNKVYKMIRDAGLSFFLIVQPVDFMDELIDEWNEIYT